jgi:uncharacterized damage-inducible protein DinB
MISRPSLDEFPPYMKSYIELIPEGDIVEILSHQMDNAVRLLANVTESQAQYRYGEGKWALSEVLGHLTDTERIMSYRILRIARGDKSPLLGFDENDFVKEASFHIRTMAELLEDYQNVRRSTISLLNGLPQKSLEHAGTANGFKVTVETIAYMIAGHELHHFKIIENKYLNESVRP